MQLWGSNSLTLLAKCGGWAPDTFDSVLLLGVDRSYEDEEGVEEDDEEEVGEERLLKWIMVIPRVRTGMN